MRNRLSKLVDVKSKVTLLLTIVFCILSLLRFISSDNYMTVYTVIIAFYFGTQYQKGKNERGDKDE